MKELFNQILVDQLIDIRQKLRDNKQWEYCDQIRNYLDEKLIFVFDNKDSQDVYYLTENYFRFQAQNPLTNQLSKRKYVEYKIKQDIQAEKNFEAWLYSINESMKSKNKPKDEQIH